MENRNEKAQTLEVAAARYQGRLFAGAFRILKNAAAAEDAVQKTFLVAGEKLATFQGDSDICTWLWRICINICLMELRKAYRRREVFIHEDGEEEGQNEYHGATSNTASPEIVSEIFFVRKQMARLREGDRALLEMHYLEGLSYTEIGDSLGRNPDTIKTTVFRLIQSLRHALLRRRKTKSKDPLVA